MTEAMARARSESGFALIEVVVSAAVLALVALAVLSGIDGASASSAREKARAVAMSLAEADQERLRQLPVTDLAKVADTSPYIVPDPAGGTRTVGSASYTITSTAQWVRDDSGQSASCTTDSHAADYFHITSTVTSNIVGTRINAATIDSITSPNVAYSSTHGTLAVRIVDPTGSGVAGKLVSVSGGTNPPAPKQTNALGCAVFEQVQAATAGTDYTITLNTPGWVDHFGATTVTRTTKVTPGKLSLITIPYAPSVGPFAASVYTYAPGTTATAPGTLVASVATDVSAVNVGETGMLRTWTSGTAEQGAQSATNLFPFTGAYTFFTGTCHYNDPTDQADYPNVNTVAPNAALIAGQQKLASALSASVVQPPLNVEIAGLDSKGVAPAAAWTVTAIPQAPATDTCAQPRITTLKTFKVGTAWKVMRTATDAGVPFGKYTFCVKDGNSKYWTSPVYDNTTPPSGVQSSVKYTPAKAEWSGTAC
jgi:type II secretory pathway pseudopilin PulG